MRDYFLTALVCFIAASSSMARTDAQELDKAKRLTSIIVVSPMVGRGTYDDPLQPAVIRASEKKDEDGRGVSFRYLLGDDGRTAIVEISGLSGAKRADLKTKTDLATEVIERETTKKEEVETVLKRVKKNFRWEDLAGVRVSSEVGK